MKKVPSPSPEPPTPPTPPTPTGEDPEFVFSNNNTKELSKASSEVSSMFIGYKYKGTKRAVTLSGKKPSNVTYTNQSSDDRIYAAASGNIPTGMSSASLIITLTADETYRESTITFTITNVAESAIVDI